LSVISTRAAVSADPIAVVKQKMQDGRTKKCAMVEQKVNKKCKMVGQKNVRWPSKSQTKNVRWSGKKVQGARAKVKQKM
jgi:hypothetical protein